MKPGGPSPLELAKKSSLMRYIVRQLLVLERRALARIKKSVFLRAVTHRQLFSFRLHPLGRGLAIGMFWMAMPMPFQMVPATVSCALAFANLPAALLAVWISNPLTYVPIFYVEYQIGKALFGGEELAALSFEEFAARHGEIAESVGQVYIAVLQGALVLGVVAAVIGYLLAIPLNRYLSRFVKRRWRRDEG